MDRRREEILKRLKEPGILTDELKRAIMELLVFPPERRKMTYEEFLDWADEDTLAEWVDGKVVIYTPASLLHQNVVRFLGALLGLYAEFHGLGVVLLPPFQMKLASSGREPDLLFVARENLSRLKDAYLDGPADLVVEVVSPESERRDRGEKFWEYQEGGVKEYWLIDPEKKKAEFWELSASGRFQLRMEGSEGKYESKVVEGFWLKIEWLWSPPPVLEALKELGVLP
ncbi:MAG: Uma2 family endonuclease [Anaerolineae bacterium]|nr:Uma2 family endonuclease [Anaerolineae bacterium]MDW8101463.1 Uma2 family endonuclease [Anaerolineae bacterium]